jgi:restriction system protein
MTVWLVRAGRHGENEAHALSHSAAVIGWDELGDLAGLDSFEDTRLRLQSTYSDAKESTISNWVSQVWAFVRRIEVGDLVALPLKTTPAIAFGRVTGPYRFDPAAGAGAMHQRPVEWLVDDMPRSRIDQDLLYSLGAFMTVCQIKRNNAEARLRGLISGTGSAIPAESPGAASDRVDEDAESQVTSLDLATYARDRIRALLGRRFRGHELARLVDELLSAQGHTTYRSPAGPDGGVDVLAGAGSMGFDSPRLCVQVKSSDAPVDAPALRELQGVMHNFSAERGLLVAWGGFTKVARKEASRLFFQIRLWDSDDLIDQLAANYDRLPPDTQAEIPLTRIWTLVPEEG